MKKNINKIKSAIIGTKFENNTYLVGGYVRDGIMNRKSNDIDIVVNLENGGIDLANFLYNKKLCSKPIIYKNFGTALVNMDNIPVELVMTRKESYRSNSRNPSVKPATIAEDALRRDFTVNSLYQNISTDEILDVVGMGIRDIKAKIIRTVTNPERVFSEDPLRMLRAVRFAVKLDFILEKNTFDSIIKNADRLKIVSAERIREEFVASLLSNNPERAVKLLVETNLMDYIIPEFKEILGLKQNRYHNLDVFHHTLKVVGNTPSDKLLRIAALLHDIGKGRTKFVDDKGNVHFHRHETVGAKMAKIILKRLKFSHAFIREVDFLIRNHLRTKQYGSKAEIVTDKTIRRLITDSGELLLPLLALIDADNKAHSPEHSMPHQIEYLKKRIKKLISDIKMNKMPVNGFDLIKNFNLKEGAEVGKMLKKARDIWLTYPKISQKELLDRLREK